MLDGYELFEPPVPEEKQENAPDPKKSNIIIAVLSVIIVLLSACVVLLLVDKYSVRNYKVIVIDTDADKYNQVQIFEDEAQLSEAMTSAAEVTEAPENKTTEQAATNAEKSTAAAETTATQQSKPAQSGKININTASVYQLTSLKGIGEKKAQAIVEYRNENGAFGSIDEIMKVSGIGEKIFESIKDYITVG